MKITKIDKEECDTFNKNIGADRCLKKRFRVPTNLDEGKIKTPTASTAKKMFDQRTSENFTL